MYDQANDAHNEQQVNQAARNVEYQKAHKPSHQEHDKECEKHTVTLLCREDPVNLDFARPSFHCLCSLAQCAGQNESL
jgi:hypothetical protein